MKIRIVCLYHEDLIKPLRKLCGQNLDYSNIHVGYRTVCSSNLCA
jgi:hypothetical protein